MPNRPSRPRGTSPLAHEAPLPLRHRNRARAEPVPPRSDPEFRAWCNDCHDYVPAGQSSRCAWCDLAPEPATHVRYVRTHEVRHWAERDVRQLRSDPHVRNIQLLSLGRDLPRWTVSFEATRQPRFNDARRPVQVDAPESLH